VGPGRRRAHARARARTRACARVRARAHPPLYYQLPNLALCFASARHRTVRSPGSRSGPLRLRAPCDWPLVCQIAQPEAFRADGTATAQMIAVGGVTTPHADLSSPRPNRTPTKRLRTPWCIGGETNEQVIANALPRVDSSQPNRVQSKRRRAAWSAEEDTLLRLAVARCSDDWKSIAVDMAQVGRTAKQCRARWNTRAAHGITGLHGWSVEEDTALVMLRVEFQCKWGVIRTTMPWRSNMDIKNRFAVHCRSAWGGAGPSRGALQGPLSSSTLEVCVVVVAACLAMCAPLDWEFA